MEDKTHGWGQGFRIHKWIFTCKLSFVGYNGVGVKLYIFKIKVDNKIVHPLDLIDYRRHFLKLNEYWIVLGITHFERPIV